MLAGALLLFFSYHVTRLRLDAVWPPALRGDAAIFHDRSLEVLALADYPARLGRNHAHAVFPYPPGAVMLFGALAAAGPAAFMTAWLVLMGAALVVSLRASLAQEPDHLRAAWLLVGSVALVLTAAPVEWDLRNANSNLVSLGLVLGGFALAGRRPLCAGMLVGLSVSLKLYSGLLLPWLVLAGSGRAALAAAATTAALWLLVPAAVMGVAGALQLLAGWLAQARIVSDPWVYALLAEGRGGPPLVTLRRAVMTLGGAGPEAAVTWLGVIALWALWLAALLWYARRALAAGRASAPSRAALADWTVLLLAPLPLSPWLEPYHAVPVLAGAILCVTIACDARVAGRDRRVAVIGLGILAGLQLVRVPFLVRGLALLAQFLVIVGALGALRPRLTRHDERLAIPSHVVYPGEP